MKTFKRQLEELDPLLDEDSDESLFEMVNIVPKRTGIKGAVLWIVPKSNRERHGPRVKVEIQNKVFVFTLEKEPKLQQDLSGMH